VKSFHLIILLGFLAMQSISFSQEDSTKTSDNWKWHWEDEDKWDWKWNEDFDFGFSKSRPAISLSYGFARIDRKDINKNFVKPNLIELKLGYIKDKSVTENENIISQSYRNIFIANESNKLAGSESAGLEIESDMWRIGFGRSQGYGYKLAENSSVILFNGYTFNWSRVDFRYPNIYTFTNDPEIDVLNKYDESFRFGTSGVGGVSIKATDNLMLDAYYERSIIFQRHLFWKWAGSTIIESIGNGLLDKFFDEIFESSPSAAPVVNFVLKSALTYGMYELRKDKMNWPFNSDSPLTYDQFKFGLTFIF